MDGGSRNNQAYNLPLLTTYGGHDAPPAMALPRYADKKFAGVGENDLRVTVTPAGLARAVEGLEGLYKSGLRYPIGSYSLTSDILAGLPEHYLEF